MINTGEAAQEREKNRERPEDDDEDGSSIPEYDFGPKEMLVNLVRDHYPTQQFADDVDQNGNAIKVPCSIRPDKDGRRLPVENPEAVAARDALIAQINRDLHMPQNPLDVLIDGLGGSKRVCGNQRAQREVRSRLRQVHLSWPAGNEARRSEHRRDARISRAARSALPC